MRVALLLSTVAYTLGLIYHPGCLGLLVNNQHSSVRLSCSNQENPSPVHLITESAGDGESPGKEKEKKDIVSVCEYLEGPKLGCVYQRAGDEEGCQKDARTRLELFSLHVFGRNLTEEGNKVTYRNYNLSDEKAVTTLRDLYKAERLLSLSKDFPPSQQRLEVDQNPALSPKDKSRAKFIETMLSQHARRIALMNQREPSDEEKKEVAAIDLFLSANHGGDSSLRERYRYKRTDHPEAQRSLLKQLLVWFREEFPYYYSGCLQCDSEDTKIGGYIGCVYPTSEERAHRAGVCELYCCSLCGGVTRFPRYHSMRKVLTTRRGRCGEYSILIMRMLEQLGYESRYVVDWEDHVWAEVRIGGRWTHVDSCEASIDEPLLYNSWGKKQTHIYSFRPHRPRHEPLILSSSSPIASTTIASKNSGAVVEDVTRSYTPEHAWGEVLTRRELDGIDEACVAEAMRQATAIISQGVDE